MRAVVQRVKEARVSISGETVGRIDRGLLVYLGVGGDDAEKDVAYLAEKIAGLRIFPDQDGAMNHSVVDAGGSALVISQFTLHGDARRGRRPSFTGAMAPAQAEPLYERFIRALERSGVPCASGRFGAMMEIFSINDGPVTILLDSTRLF